MKNDIHKPYARTESSVRFNVIGRESLASPLVWVMGTANTESKARKMLPVIRRLEKKTGYRKYVAWYIQKVETVTTVTRTVFK